MLINIINNKLINTLKQFLNSKWMMFLIVAAAAISNLFGLEIITYYIYTGIIIFTILFNEAMLPLFPIPCVAYMTFAKRNNPLSVEKTSTFLHNSSAIHMLIIGITISIFVIPRIIHDIVKNKDRRKMPKLLYGFIALGLSYILGGIFSKAYGFRTAFFGLVEILTLSFTYFCLHNFYSYIAFSMHNNVVINYGNLISTLSTFFGLSQTEKVFGCNKKSVCYNSFCIR